MEAEADCLSETNPLSSAAKDFPAFVPEAGLGAAGLAVLWAFPPPNLLEPPAAEGQRGFPDRKHRSSASAPKAACDIAVVDNVAEAAAEEEDVED